MKYLLRYRRWFFWRKVFVIGHRYEELFDKLVLFLEDGGVEEISRWSKCDLRLGLDWALAVKKSAEEKAGQSIPVANVK